jgi:hypothetical protein
MPTVTFPSADAAEVIEVEFAAADGYRRLKLLVDSGFTGQSSLVLGADATDLIRAVAAPAPVIGALQGEQERAWVSCRIADLGFTHTLIAILTDLSPLSLPPGVEGMAGLSFLRHFTRWGAEQSDGCWQSFLTLGDE